VRLLPELGGDADATRPVSPDGTGSPGRLFEQLRWCLLARPAPPRSSSLSRTCPGRDRSTRDFLAFLVREIRRERLTLILTYRNDEIDRRHPAHRFLFELERSGQAIRLELTRFQRGELREQVTAILGESAGSPEFEPGTSCSHSPTPRIEPATPA
jgi:hypothetical protein